MINPDTITSQQMITIRLGEIAKQLERVADILEALNKRDWERSRQ